MTIRRRAVGAVAGSMLLAAALMAPRFAVAARWGAMTPITREFLDRAVAGDSAGMAAVSIGDAPIGWGRRVLVTQPEVLAAAARTAVPVAGGYIGDGVAVVDFDVDAEVCPGIAGAAHQIQVQFRMVGPHWRVARVSFVPC